MLHSLPASPPGNGVVTFKPASIVDNLLEGTGVPELVGLNDNQFKPVVLRAMPPAGS